MKQRLRITLALALTLAIGITPLASLAFGRNPAKENTWSKSERLFRLPGRPKPANQSLSRNSGKIEGQTTTLLADGRLLLVGGIGPDGEAVSSSIFDPRNGETIVLTEKSLVRSWHSATMLPDGKVLIVGGFRADARVFEKTGIFDPEKLTFQELSKPALTPRAYHTATLLTDGRVLIVGGVSARNLRPAKAELWNFKTQTSKTAIGESSAQRSKAQATLLSDGNVLIDGGFDENGSEIGNPELFNSEAEGFSLTTMSDRADVEKAFVTASLPRDGATEVEADSLIALRFSKPLNVESQKAEALKLSSEGRLIDAKITFAEGGRLAFLLPAQPLDQGITYTVTCNDGSGANKFTPAVFSFTTAGNKKEGEQELLTQPLSDVDWAPDADNRRGNWRSKGEKSIWEDQPPLQGKPGETSLSGLVLTLRAQPLPGVTISVNGRSARTDKTGRFLVSDIPSGHHVMLIDGSSASRPGASYGIFRAGVDVASNTTNVLPFKIWMPKLDMAHAVTIPSPNKRDLVITNPLIPGLELRLPAGTVIRDLDGRAVTQISITPVPTDRPPFPLPPGFTVPVFASIQPGGARLIPPRAQLIYPNYTNKPAGARVNFWNYDPEVKGWYIYGQGTVTPNGKQIIPDAGVVVYEFTGIMIGDGGDPPTKGRKPGNGPGNDCCDPVDLATGLFVHTNTDLAVADVIPIKLQRTYRPEDNTSRPFGIGATHPYDMFLWSNNNYQEVDLILPDGGRIHYVRISPGTGFTDAVYEHTSSPSAFYKSRISWVADTWELKLTNGTVYVFPEFAPLHAIRDRFGNQITMTRTAGNYGYLTQITSSNGRWIQFTNDSSYRISQAKDNTGRTVNYTYDTGGRLWKVTDPVGGVTEYTYDSANRMLTLKDARGIVYLTNEYDSAGRVTKQTQADNSTYQIAYTLDTNGAITQADVTDPRGNIRRVTFNSSGYTLSETRALGTSEQQVYTYSRQSGTNFLVSATDALSRTTAFTYDAMGNLASVTRMSGTSEALSTTLTYEPGFNQVASITDPLNHTTAFGYDLRGNLISINDPLNHETTLTYNAAGQPLSWTNALQHTTGFSYAGGDLVAITDPLGRTVTALMDALGRPITVTNGLGQQTRNEYNKLDRLMQTKDALQGVTAFTYDANSNLLSVTDARNSVISYVYNNMDRATTRRDPLLHDETYQYDLNGNLTQVTDRKGQVRSYSYDALNRLTQVTYSDASTISYTRDGGNRLTQVVDSISGTSTLAYDNLDRLTSITTPQGTISYTYDSASRRVSMTVTGQSTVNYTYDNANRLTQITRGSATVTIAYDNAGRRTSLTLPNGVVTEYEYNAASQVTEITYKMGSTVLGNLTYAYDGGGRRTKTGGTYARTALPIAITSSYNAANQQVAFGGQSLTYDLNGNLTSDGTNTYSWNARDELVSMSATGLTASFQYDALGRRISRTINGSTLTYLYDGSDLVQEKSGGSPTANILAGRLDEFFTRTDAAGTWSPLVNGIGSTLALTDANGAVQTEYTYDSFGKTTVTGSSNGNASQYTGRENDATGLYYYRNRYYSPSLQRFISEDPIGLLGGINLFAYVDNNPISYRDPFGLDKNGDDIKKALEDFVDKVKEFIKDTVIPGAAAEPLGPIMGALPPIRTPNPKLIPQKGMTPDQRALKELVDDVTLGGRKPMSVDDANTILDWADEIGYPGARANTNCVGCNPRWDGGPHFHIPGAGRGGHIPVQPGLAPRQP